MGKTALVLSGGGLTGATYHIGALRALNDVLLDRSVNDFDIYVGTSAGAVITSCLANGIRTRDLMRAVSGESSDAAIRRLDVFRPNIGEFARKLAGLPATAAWACWHYARNFRDMDLVDFFMLFADALPSGFFDSAASWEYLERVFAMTGATNDFRQLKKELVLIATDLDTGDRALFGTGHRDGVPISRAAAASSAVPVLYTPVRIAGHDYVDGGLRGNASIDIAVEHGADLVICINPLVPFDNTHRTIPHLGADVRNVRDKGFNAITNQVARTMLHAGLHYHLKQLRRAHPEVDIILIEPKRSDARMFFNNPMRFSSKMLVAHHGYESVLVELEENLDKNRHILERHGIAFRRSMVREQLRRIRRAGYDPQVISEVLQTRSSQPLQVGAQDVRWDRLASTLELLDREVTLRNAGTRPPVAVKAAKPVARPRRVVARRQPTPAAVVPSREATG